MKYIATFNGKTYEVEVEKADSGYKPMSRGEVAASAGAKSSSVAPVAAATPAPVVESAGVTTNVTSPMPGSMLDIKVAVGDIVKPGQVLLIMEAMKMENEIVAPCDATVASIPVKKGDVVDTDDILVVLK